MSSQAWLACVCGCSAVPLVWGGFGCLTGHFYALPKVGTKNPNIKQFFSSSASPYWCCLSPDLLGFFLIAEVGTVYFCCGSHCLSTPQPAGFAVTYCPPHCVWQMHKAGRQRLLIPKVVVHIVPASFPSASQHAG